MKTLADRLRPVWELYRDGFRNMTWGRPLIWLILLKIFILFAILRVFFFRPAMAGMSEREKSEAVGERITQTPHNQTDTLNLISD
jgi:hypothetical protein